MNEPSAVGPLVQMAPFALIILVFYFMLIRPQQRKAKETQEMLDNLKLNDEIVTTGGLHGRIVKLADAVVSIEVAPKVQLRIERSAVGRLAKSTAAKGEEKS